MILMIVPYRYSISYFNPSISDIRIICVGMPVNAGVFSVLFQGWTICANNIILLGMSLKIVDALKGQFSWSTAFNFSFWGGGGVQSSTFSSVFFG